MNAGLNQYAQMRGVPSLCEAIAEKITATYGKAIDPHREICITAGATQAVFTAIQTLVHPGDEVILFDPAFDIYVPSIQLCGGMAVRIPLEFPEFSINWEKVRDAITGKTRAIIINSPHNPTGSTLSAEDMQHLERIVEAHGLYVISDEVYEHLIFDGKRHESVLRYDSIYNRCIATFSFGKTFHNTGWKVGYAVGPPDLMNEFCKIHQFVVFSVNRPVQHALADYMQDPETYRTLPEFYQAKRNTFLELLQGSKFTCRPSSGTYFQLLDYSELSSKTDIDFALELVEVHGVASIPLGPFYESGNAGKTLRFCFAKTNDILEQAAQRLCAI
jgi:methionine aminotransferase